MSPAAISRRALLAAPLALTAGAVRVASAESTGPRVAALDWTLAAACLSIGIVPVGVAEQRLYRGWVREPVLPAGVTELGLRTAPSLEGLAALRPDLILVNALDEPLRPQLERIAATLSLSVYGDDHRPLALAAETLRDLGRRFGRQARAETVLADADADFARLAAALAGPRRAPVLPVTFEDARHLRVYGAGSLFADTLARLDLDSAWTGPTGPWGTADAEVASIAAYPGATLVTVEPIPADARSMLDGSGLWAALASGRGGAIMTLPPVWPYGETGAARRFAGLLTPVLLAGPAARQGEVPHAG